MKKKLHTLLYLTTIGTIVIHLYNRYVSLQSNFKDILSLYRHNYYNWKSGRVYYTVMGEGKPLILIHDLLPGGSGYEWNRIQDQLAVDHKLYILDFPGCGRSDKNNISYTSFHFVQMLGSFIRDIIGEPSDILTTGFSSGICVMTKLFNPDMIDKMIFINPLGSSSYLKPITPTMKIYKKIVDFPVFGTLLYHIHVSHEEVSNLFINRFYHNPFRVDRDITDAYYEAAHIGGYYCKNLYAAIISGNLNLDITKGLSFLEDNAFILFGKYEPQQNQVLFELSEHINRSHVSIIPDSKHFPHIEMPSETTQALLDILKA